MASVSQPKDRSQLTVGDIPPVSDDLAAFLKEWYPQICWNPTKQEEWQHHRYAGMAALADALIARNDLEHENAGVDLDADRAQDLN